MPDQLVEVKEATKMPPEERFRRGVHETMVKWVDSDFKKELSALIKKGDSMSKAVSLATLSRDLIFAMHILIEDGVAKEYDTELTDIMFGTHDNSVVNCCGKNNRQKVIRQLIGPISVLTFVDALKKTGNKYVDKLQISELVTEPDVDVRHKVDLVLRLGTETESGKEVARLVQLKSTTKSTFQIEKVIPGEERNTYMGGKIAKSEVNKMIEYADSIKGNQDAHVMMYLVEVPAYDTNIINNVFGIAQPSIIGENTFDDKMNKFREESIRSGLLPKSKE